MGCCLGRSSRNYGLKERFSMRLGEVSWQVIQHNLFGDQLSMLVVYSRTLGVTAEVVNIFVWGR